jgi:outer membrane protein TolC
MTMPPQRTLNCVTAITLALGLSACANLMPPAQVDALVAPQWQAPLPHQGAVGSLTQWWQQQGDPLPR